MHAKSGGSSGEPPDFLFIPAACRSRKDLPRSAGGGQGAEHGQPSAGRRRRGHGHGAQETRVRGHGHRAQGSGAAGAGCGARVRKTEDAGVGRRTQNAEHVDADAGTGTGRGRRETGDGRRGTGDGHKPPCMERNATAYAPPGPATTRRGHSQPGAIRHRDLQQPAGAVHSRAPSAAGRRYLSRVRIRITPLPPRTPYMLLPRCTSTDLTS